jgi:predicted DNA-binding transcriptional regulator YafY
MTSDKTARWLDLVAFLLQRRFPVTREEVFEHVRGYGAAAPRGAGDKPQAGDAAADESARRKFERDKDELRALGIAIETVQLKDVAGDEPQSGYRLRPGGFYLPCLELTDAGERGPGGGPVRGLYPGLARVPISRDELRVLDRATRRLAARTELPLASAAASARRKLAFDLPLSEAAVERVLAFPLPEEGRRSLAVLQQAVARRAAVACRYYSIGRDAQEDREIEPYGLLFQWSRWYCVARARDRDALRVFRVDRMGTARPLAGEPPHFAVPDSFDVRRYLHRAPWELGDQPATAVRVRFGFPEARWVVSRGVGRVVDHLLEDGGARVEFAVRERPAFLRWLLTFRRQATVEWPDDVARDLEALRQRVARIYE